MAGTPFYAGEFNQQDNLGTGNPRYFYALRRTQDGGLYFDKIDQLTSNEGISINVPGPAENNFEAFEWGVDFFDGRLASDHSRPYPNLNFDQYRWDQRNMYYYINSNGVLVARVNQTYNYNAATTTYNYVS
jgi:hypothetical protein